MNQKFNIIYSDPPWSFGGRRLNAATDGKEIADHYPTMEDEELLSLPVQNIAADDSILFMWVVHSKLPFALELMKAWGFHYSTVAFEWFKTTSTGKPVCFMGAWVCGGAIELCLLGRRGHPKRISKTVRRLIVAPRGKHSAKPPETRDRIVELMGDIPRVELFARETALGWTVLGNDIDGRDIKTVLDEYSIDPISEAIVG